MGTECHGFRVLCAEAFEDLCPEDTGSTHLCDFHEVVLALIPEEGQTLCEGIDRQACFFAAADIFHAVCQGVAQFEIAGCAAFLDMVAGNGNGIELRHVLGGVFEDITDDTHGHGRRINVGVTNHEFLQDIVLNGALENLLVYALFDAGGNEECQNRKYGTVHGHGYGHLVQRNSVKQNVHIEHGANGYACFTNVAYYTGVIGIVAAVGRKVECNGQTFLACCQVSLVECVGFFSGREACVLADGPWTEYIHGGVWSAEERRNTAHEIQVVAVFVYVLGIERTYRDTFQGGVIEVVIFLACFAFQRCFPLVVVTAWMSFQVQFCKIGICCHIILPPLP